MYGTPGDDYMTHYTRIARRELRRWRFQKWAARAARAALFVAVVIGVGVVW